VALLIGTRVAIEMPFEVDPIRERGCIADRRLTEYLTEYLIEFDRPPAWPRPIQAGETDSRRWLDAWWVRRLSVLELLAEAAI
jgi:hypothetical protein